LRSDKGLSAFVVIVAGSAFSRRDGADRALRGVTGTGWTACSFGPASTAAMKSPDGDQVSRAERLREVAKPETAG